MGTPKTSAMIPPAHRMGTVTYSDPPGRRGSAQGGSSGEADSLAEYRRSRRIRVSSRPRTWSRRSRSRCATARTATARLSDCSRRARPWPRRTRRAAGPSIADRVVLTAGSSEGIDFVLTALADPGDEVLVPLPTYPLYTAILHKIGAREVYYRTDPKNGWQPDPTEVREADHTAHQGDRRQRSEQPDRRRLSRSRFAASC